MNVTTFSESFYELSIVPYNDMQMDPSYDMKLSSSYEKSFQSLEIMNANPLCSIGDALKDLKERVKISNLKNHQFDVYDIPILNHPFDVYDILFHIGSPRPHNELQSSLHYTNDPSLQCPHLHTHGMISKVILYATLICHISHSTFV